MVKTFREYDELIEKFEAMPNTMHDYGITREDMAKMDAEPEKYAMFVMYLSTRSWYQGKGDNDHVFINSDALKPVDAAFLIDEFINTHIFENMEDDDDTDDVSESDVAAMRAMLGLK